jgi:hypothetical protein
MSGCALLMSAEIRCSQPGLYLFREILPSMQRRLASIQIFGRTRPPSLNILRMLCFQIVTFESGRDAASIGIRGFSESPAHHVSAKLLKCFAKHPVFILGYGLIASY